MITKKDLREIKDLIKQVSDKIEALQGHENFGKLGIAEYKEENGKLKPSGYTESAQLVVLSFLPRLQWFNKRLDKWIDKVPAGKRGPNKGKKK